MFQSHKNVLELLFLEISGKFQRICHPKTIPLLPVPKYPPNTIRSAESAIVPSER